MDLFRILCFLSQSLDEKKAGFHVTWSHHLNLLRLPWCLQPPWAASADGPFGRPVECSQTRVCQKGQTSIEDCASRVCSSGIDLWIIFFVQCNLSQSHNWNMFKLTDSLVTDASIKCFFLKKCQTSLYIFKLLSWRTHVTFMVDFSKTSNFRNSVH